MFGGLLVVVLNSVISVVKFMIEVLVNMVEVFVLVDLKM